MRKTISLFCYCSLHCRCIRRCSDTLKIISSIRCAHIYTPFPSYLSSSFLFISFFLFFLPACLHASFPSVRPSVLSSLPFCLAPYFLFLPPSSLSSSCTCTSLSPSSNPSLTTILIYSTQVLVTTPYFDQLVSHLVHSKNICGLLLKTLEAQRYK